MLEVRAHEVPFLIEHEQFVGRLTYMPLLSKPEKIYGLQIGSSYQQQALTLSKHFRRQTLSRRPRGAVWNLIFSRHSTKYL